MFHTVLKELEGKINTGHRDNAINEWKVTFLQ